MDSFTIANTSTSTGEGLHQAEMPRFGLGVYLMGEPGECKASVLYALEQGYRLIDTAMAYGNEDEVGQAIRESGILLEDGTKTVPEHDVRAYGIRRVILRSLVHLQVQKLEK